LTSSGYSIGTRTAGLEALRCAKWLVPGDDEKGFRLSEEATSGRLRTRGEEALGDLAQALLENPLFNQALTAAMGAGERAAQAQRTAMGALNIPAASELERLEQRLRSLSHRLESMENRLDDVGDELAALRRRLAQRPEEGGVPGQVSLHAPDERYGEPYGEPYK
jgi:hypothetical protein